MSFSNWPPSKGAAFRSDRPPLAVKPPTRPISIEATSGAPLPEANEVSSLLCASAKGVLMKLTLILGLTLAYSLAQIFPPSSHHQKVISVTAVLPWAGAWAPGWAVGWPAAGAPAPAPQAASRPAPPALAARRRKARRESTVPGFFLSMIVAFFLVI